MKYGAIESMLSSRIAIHFKKIMYDTICLLYHFICNASKLATHQSSSINSNKIWCNHLT